MTPLSPQNVLTPGLRAELARGRWYAIGCDSQDDRPVRVRIGAGGEIELRGQAWVFVAPAEGPREILCLGPGELRVRVCGAWEGASGAFVAKLALPGILRAAGSALRLLARGQWGEFAHRLTRGAAPDFEIAPDPPADLPPRGARIAGRRPRMAIVGPALVPGGAQFCQLELAAGLAARGLVEVVVLAPESGALAARYARAGLRFETNGPRIETALDLAGYRAAVDRLAAWLRAENIDIVLANTLGAFHAIEAARRANCAAILNPRESERDFFADRSRAVQARALAAFDMADRVVFVAQATREAWRSFDRGNFAVVPDGLGPEAVRPGEVARDAARARLGMATGSFLALCVGTVAARKGQLDLIQAVAALDPALDLRAALVGARGGAYAQECARAIAAGAPGRVEMVAETVAVADWYAAADAFVLCSRHESYPRVVLEAMAHGLPIVATPVDGVVEQLREGIDADFYAPGDTPALAVALARLARDPGLRASRGAAAQARLAMLPGYEAMLDGYAREIDAAITSSGIADPAAR